MPITDRAARALEKGETHSEKVAGRGAGVLLLVGRGNSVTGYYRYTAPDRSRPWIELGSIGKDITLAEARARCAELAALKTEHPCLKEWLESESLHQQETLIEEKRQRDRDALTGTFKELLNDYLGKMKAQSQPSEVQARNILENEVITPFPALMEKKAREIEPADVSRVLKRVSDRKAYSYRNRVRAYLHAAFVYALKHEFNETRVSGKLYGLTTNPVAAIPVLENVEKTGERTLTVGELRQLFLHLHKVKNVSPMMADFIRFLILSAGQRPLQVLRVPWADYDLEQGTILIEDTKGRGGKRHARLHLVPLSDAAIDILLRTREITGDFQWPFTSTGKNHLHIGSIKNVMSRFLNSPYAVVDGEQIPHFTARDLRRTCKHIMIRAGIRRDLRNLLQNHGMTGVDVKNYGSDPYAYLPDKRQAMAQYTVALNVILGLK
jgi:integrase